MSQQRIPPDKREALWEAHGRKCFHCPKTLALGETHVDHLIPESTPAHVVTSLKEQGVIPTSFSLKGPENWVPACSDCNGTKHNIVFKPGYLHGRVIAAERKLSRYHDELRQKKRTKTIDRIARDATRGVASGEFTRSELIRAIRQIEGQASRLPARRGTSFLANRQPSSSLQLAGRARLDVEARGLAISDFAALLLSAIETGTFKAVADRTRPGRIVLRITPSVRVVVSVNRGQAVVERVLIR